MPSLWPWVFPSDCTRTYYHLIKITHGFMPYKKSDLSIQILCQMCTNESIYISNGMGLRGTGGTIWSVVPTIWKILHVLQSGDIFLQTFRPKCWRMLTLVLVIPKWPDQMVIMLKLQCATTISLRKDYLVYHLPPSSRWMQPSCSKGLETYFFSSNPCSI